MEFKDRYFNVPHCEGETNDKPSLTEVEGFVSAYDRIKAIMYAGGMIHQIPKEYYDFYGTVEEQNEFFKADFETQFRESDEPIEINASLDRASALLNARRPSVGTPTPTPVSVEATEKVSVESN